MLSFTSAWEDTSYVTELKAVAGSVTKQSRDFVTCSPSPLHSPHLQIHTAQPEHCVSSMAFPSFKWGERD